MAVLAAGLIVTEGVFAANCSISTVPNPAFVDAGQTVDFTGSVTGKSPRGYHWTFGGGTPGASSQQSVTVLYESAGNFSATLDGTDGKGGACTASVTVIVAAGGNNPPVAQDDSYNAKQDIQLVIPAPGVLTNDNDPDVGDMIAAVAFNGLTTAGGTVNLASDGSFTYDPPSGQTGGDSFEYRATDGGLTSNLATVTIGVAGIAEVSINSTSTSGLPDSAVGELPWASDPDYALLAINDLGMHCGDLDTRISSILPPFNVLHAQVVRRGDGTTGLPRVLDEGEVTLEYSAASNPDDPAPGKVAAGDALSSMALDGSVYKTNFWDVVAAYDPFYPPALTPLSNPVNGGVPGQVPVTADVGLPMPDVERFYLGDGALHVSHQAMPGIGAPDNANAPQVFQEHVGTLPFFTSFAFGYTANINLFEAAGVPIAAFDDFGRENPYPLVRVQAKIGPDTVASLDTVMPISGEAECQSCHAAAPEENGIGGDGGNGTATENLTTVTAAFEDPAYGEVPLAVSVEWASDLNILRLHDQKHLTELESDFDPDSGRAVAPVVCQTCHYTPALDLAQLGPLGPEHPTLAALANGRDQLKHKTMSNVMHSHHSETGLFRDMPPAIDGQGNRRDPALTREILEETCYSCHPGKRTQCMRGAMANGGLVCQDCHGQMAQVGDDFSRKVSPDPMDVGQFEISADFYTNSATPRVPWANEPGCGSCHTGYATDNLAGTANVLVNPTDTLGNTDGIRLLAAYRTNDSKATPIVPGNKAFAENTVAEGTDADGNPKLYRVSTGHGGLFCEGCHGSTHAEWPAANPNANDNVMAGQIQGHSGYIAECTVCHDPTDESLPLGNNGPHGMHAIVDLEPVAPAKADTRWNKQHRNFRNQGPGCESCHGTDLKGTVLSRTADERTVQCKDDKGSLPECAAGQPTAIIPKGTPVGCGMCHQQKGKEGKGGKGGAR